MLSCVLFTFVASGKAPFSKKHVASGKAVFFKKHVASGKALFSKKPLLQPNHFPKILLRTPAIDCIAVLTLKSAGVLLSTDVMFSVWTR